MADLQAQITSLRESMEAETLSKVDLQNNIQSLKEELAFRKKVYEEVSCVCVCVCVCVGELQSCGQHRQRVLTIHYLSTGAG